MSRQLRIAAVLTIIALGAAWGMMRTHNNTAHSPAQVEASP